MRAPRKSFTSDATATNPQSVGRMFNPNGFGDSIGAESFALPIRNLDSPWVTKSRRRCDRNERAETQDVDRLKKTGLSAAVRTNKEIDTKREFDIDSFENSQTPNLDCRDTHDGENRRPTTVRPLTRRCTRYSRIGITTN